MADQEALLDKVRHLRALAKDAQENNSPHEAEAAFARANELIQRYRLSEAELDHRPEEIAHESLDRTESRKIWRTFLAYDLAKHYGCTAYDVHGVLADKTPFHEIRMVGRRSDLQFVKAIYAWIKLEIASLADRHARAPEAQESFRLGAVEGLRQKLEESRDAAERAHAAERGEDAYVSAVMVLQRRDKEAEDHFKAAYAAISEKVDLEQKEIKAPPMPDVRDVSAFENGRIEGGKIELEPKKKLGKGARK